VLVGNVDKYICNYYINKKAALSAAFFIS